MPGPATVLRQVVDLHRAQLQGIIELRGIRKMRKMYEESRLELQDKLRAFERGARGGTFQAHHIRLVLAQVEDALRTFDLRLKGHLQNNARLAGTAASRHLVTSVAALEKKFTGATPVIQTAQAAVLRRVYEGVEPALLNRFSQSLRFYTVPVVEKVRNELARSLVQGESVDTATDRVAGTDGVFSGQRWRAERIVRTELAYSYGVTKQKTMEELRSRDLPNLQKKLIATFDDRTGDDSKQLHGQTVPIDQPFKWVTPKGQIVYYMQPPNRPNDREIVIPWCPGWPETAMTAPDPSNPPGAVTPRAPR